MISETPGLGNPVERELSYYRRECNDLGARLLRLQEEQSQAFLEARRSRTVVRMVREAYRLAEPAQATHDVGGALLQIVVENALCDRAALLREEPAGSGRFLVAHAIGGTNVEVDEAVTILNPPRFFFTSSTRLDRPPGGLMDVLHLPFVLWAYDRSSGHALAIGNRSESNVSRPFESGDQELIETALSVYLDVLYRKNVEAQLRQARQAAEETRLAQAQFLEALAQQIRPPIERLVALSQGIAAHAVAGPEQAQEATRQMAESARELVELANDALRLANPADPAPSLDVQWTDLADTVRRIHRAAYPVSVKNGVELTVTLPRRQVSVCVDRDGIHRAVQMIMTTALTRVVPGSIIKLAAERRSDGSVEIVVSSRNDEGEPIQAIPQDTRRSVLGDDHGPVLVDRGADRLSAARRIVEAHGGILVTEPRPGGGRHARIILPAQAARDEAML